MFVATMSRRVKIGVGALLCIVYLFIWQRAQLQENLQYSRWAEQARKTWIAQGMGDVYNATLGFQEIFVINLPSRTDRRDAMALAGSLTGLHFSFSDGVNISEMDQKALPEDSAGKHITPGNIGSWRAHMNVLRAILENNLTSALVMEDDIDWDVRLKSQIQAFALASQAFVQPLAGGRSPIPDRYIPPFDKGSALNGEQTPIPTDAKYSQNRNSIALQNLPRHEKPTISPYGDNWDVLWLGHCGTEFPSYPPAVASRPDVPTVASTPAQTSLLRITMLDDKTVPAPKHLKPHPFALQDPLGAFYPPHTRVVHASSGTLCTQAYAVSQRGARKLLHKFGLDTFTTGWDLMLRDWCDGVYMETSSSSSGAEGKGDKNNNKNKKSGPRPACLTVQPPLFSHYLFDKEASSDIQSQGGGYLHQSGSQYVRLSVRKNFGRLVDGEPMERLVDQWPDERAKK